MMHFKSLILQNSSVTSGPKESPTPRLLGNLPISTCGSDQSISHINPSFAGWRNLLIWRNSSILTPSRENKPPCKTNILESIRLPSGRQLNISEKYLNVAFKWSRNNRFYQNYFRVLDFALFFKTKVTVHTVSLVITYDELKRYYFHLVWRVQNDKVKIR